MPTADERVGRNRHVHTRAGGQQGAVVTPTQHRTGRGPCKKPLDQVELAHERLSPTWQN